MLFELAVAQLPDPEQLIVVLPELVLLDRTLGGLGSRTRTRMVVERELAVYEADLVAVRAHNLLDDGKGRKAVGALKV